RLRGGDAGGRRGRSCHAARPERASRTRAQGPPGRVGVVLLPRSRRQPRPDPLPARARGVSGVSAGPLRRSAAWGVHLFPAGIAAPVALCVVLAGAYGFCRTDAKTADHYFTGFPSYWNVVAFYLYALGWPRALNAVVVVAFSVAVFVPIRYVYPSRTLTLR